MYKVFLLTCLLSGTILSAQPKYTTANAHSHNDYERPVPFFEAYKHQFGSIEADIFLVNGSDELFVAHTATDLNNRRRTLDSLYLMPLVNCIKKNKGFVYGDTALRLQLLIDIKTDPLATLSRLITILQKYPELIHSSSLQIAISGNRPTPDSFHTYPAFIHFDGIPGTKYSKRALSRITLFSISFRQFSKWDGRGVIPENDRIALAKMVEEAHKAGKSIRFWAAPDTVDAWMELIKLKVNYINTDHIRELSSFLKNYDLPKKVNLISD